MNHAPLLARVPFCFQARKWCPPTGKSAPVLVNWMVGLLRTSETLPTGPHDREVVLSGYQLLRLLLIAVAEIRVMVIAEVDTQALFGVTDRPAESRGLIRGSVAPGEGRH